MEEEKKEELFEEITATLFLSKTLNDIIYSILEDMEQVTFEDFQDVFNYEIETDKEDFFKWELVKNYTSFNNYKQVEFETIKKEFLQDIKNCFEVIKWEQ